MHNDCLGHANSRGMLAFSIIVNHCTRRRQMIDNGKLTKNTYELLNLRALKFSPVNKIYIFQCMGKIFRLEFQRLPLEFHTKYLTHALKDTIFIQI